MHPPPPTNEQKIMIDQFQMMIGHFPIVVVVVAVVVAVVTTIKEIMDKIITTATTTTAITTMYHHLHTDQHMHQQHTMEDRTVYGRQPPKASSTGVINAYDGVIVTLVTVVIVSVNFIFI